jgi:hypothetical protein
MPKKRFSPEQIVTLLRQIEVKMHQHHEREKRATLFSLALAHYEPVRSRGAGRAFLNHVRSKNCDLLARLGRLLSHRPTGQTTKQQCCACESYLQFHGLVLNGPINLYSPHEAITLISRKIRLSF